MIQIWRVTQDSDGTFVNRGYSYWPMAYVEGPTAVVFAGHVDNQPRFFRVDLATGAVDPLGPLLQGRYAGTGEGLYWDASGWIYLCDGPRLCRVKPSGPDDVVVFDISATHPGCDVWQAHSSDDGQTHSATVRQVTDEGPYPKLGTVVQHHGHEEFWPARGVLDESQITPDGKYLVIKEDHDNRIITLGASEQRMLYDANGALGHSDCGPGYMVGENDQIGACEWVNLADLRDRRLLLHTWNMGHVSIRAGKCLLSNATDLSLDLVALDGSGITRVLQHGIGGDYDRQVRANLSPCGRVATYMLDGVVYLLVLDSKEEPDMATPKILEDNERGQTRVEGNAFIQESKIEDAAECRVRAPKGPSSGGAGKFSYDVTDGDKGREIGLMAAGEGINGAEWSLQLLKKGGQTIDSDMIKVIEATAEGVEIRVPLKAPNLTGAGGSFLQNGRYQLHVQGDGNLVLYDTAVTPWEALWNTGTQRPFPPI